MVLPKILIVYKDNDWVQSIGKLIPLIKYSWSQNEECKLEESIDIKEGDNYDLFISTKYYDAHTQFVWYKYHPDDLEDMLGAVDNLNSVIYLFKDCKELDKFFKFIDALTEKANPEISLLVHDGEEKIPDKFEKLLGIDYFIEIIRTKIDEEFENPQNFQAAGMLGEDKIGVSRIVESLQWNMWENMVRKPLKPLMSAQPKDEYPQSDEDKIDVEEANKQLLNEPRTEVIELATTKVEETKEKDEPSQVTEKVYLDPLNPLLPIPDYSHSTIPPANDFEKEERNLEELGSLMAQVKNLKDSLEGMTLEERRANAEAMIK